VNSIEETILARANYKLDLDGKVIQAGKFDNKSTEADREAFLRSLLEDSSVGQEEEDAEDDDDINEMIARTEDELNLFKQMDIERRDEDLRIWRERGNTGPMPDRLIQLEELPEVYRQDDISSEEEDPDDYGRGQRARGRVYYDDFLTEEQFLVALEDDDVDLQDVIRKKQASRQARDEGRKRKQQAVAAAAGGNTDPESEESIQVTPARRGRPPKTPKSNTGDENANASVRRGRKRKNDVESHDSDGSVQKGVS
jgi:ATP-dependent helicase STH1/SNF2